MLLFYHYLWKYFKAKNRPRGGGVLREFALLLVAGAIRAASAGRSRHDHRGGNDGQEPFDSDGNSFFSQTACIYQRGVVRRQRLVFEVCLEEAYAEFGSSEPVAISQFIAGEVGFDAHLDVERFAVLDADSHRYHRDLRLHLLDVNGDDGDLVVDVCLEDLDRFESDSAHDFNGRLNAAAGLRLFLFDLDNLRDLRHVRVMVGRMVSVGSCNIVAIAGNRYGSVAVSFDGRDCATIAARSITDVGKLDQLRFDARLCRADGDTGEYQ